MSEKTEKLEQQIRALRSEKILLSTHLSISMENYYQNRTSESIDEMNGLRTKISEIDLVLNPILTDYENEHHHYFVVFSSDMPDTFGKAKTKYTFQTNMLSEINCDIDTIKNGFDISIPNLKELVDDLGQKLIYSYTNVRFDRISKIK